MHDAGERSVWRWEGEYWTIVFERKTIRLRDSKGLRYLAALLHRPGEQVHALDLQAAAARTSHGARPARSAEQARVGVTKAIKTTLERIASAHPALARHLEVTVRRGYLCRYLPDPRSPISWEG